MRVRRFALRFLVGLLAFCVGWVAVELFGAARHENLYTAAPRYELRLEAPPRYDLAPQPPCGADKMQHAFEWRELRRPFGFDAPPPPPPPPRRPH